MRQLYFCSNCKQYHASCNKQLSHSSSIKYLRFADLFNQVPKPHPQNFTMTHPRIIENSRLVYQQNTSAKRSKFKNIRKSETNSRMTVDQKQFSRHRQTSQSLIKLKNTTNNSRLNTQLTNQYPSPISKKSLYHNNKIKQTSSSSIKHNKPLHYAIINLKYKNQPTNIQISSQSPQRTNKTNSKYQPIHSHQDYSGKDSYVYGDNYRNILVQQKKASQFKYGKLVQSKQQTAKYFKEGDINNNYALSFDQKSIAEQNKQSPVDYKKRLQKLKFLLKKSQNIKYRKQTQFTIAPFSSHNPITVQLNQQPIEASQSEPQTFKKPQMFHKNIINLPFTAQSHQKCKYLDNRCFGFNLFDEGQICFIQDMQDLK